MQAQMSFELLLYVSLAGASIAAAAAMMHSGAGTVLAYVDRYRAYQLVGEMNAMAVQGLQQQVPVYIPPGMCNSTISGSVLSTGYGDMYLYPGVYVNTSSLCIPGDAGIALADIQGQRLVEVVR